MGTGKFVGIFFAAILGLMLLFWGIGWLSVPFQVTSSDNVQKQWVFAYQYEESLRAMAAQHNSAQKALDESTSDNEKSQRRTHLLAIEQNYARIQAEYDAKLRNAFEAKYVRPSDVPARAPTLSEMKFRLQR